MKKIILLILIIPFGSVLAQGYIKAKSPQIISKLKIGNIAEFDQKTVKFIKVTEDSRCPSDLTCIWEGEVAILIELYENNTLLDEKEIVFKSNNDAKNNTLKKIADLESKAVYLYGVSPYPSAETPVIASEYYLELLVK